MRITDVKASVAFGRSIFVQVFTDEGIVGLGEAHHKQMVPHQTMPSVGTAANIQFIASLRDAHRPQELTRIDRQLNSLFKEPLVFESGCLTVPTKPGLGLELDEAAFARACEG